MLAKIDDFKNRWESSDFYVERDNLVNYILRVLPREVNIINSVLIEFMQRTNNAINTGISMYSEDFPRVHITVDSDFDGYASAKQMYKLMRTLGIHEDCIQFHFLTSLHTTEETIELTNDLLLITDTSVGHVIYTSNSESRIIHIDHHSIESKTYVDSKYILEDRGKGTIINTMQTNEDLLMGMSCGAFTYLLNIAVLRTLGFDSKRAGKMELDYDEYCRLEGMLSLFSDMMDTNKYVGLVKGIYTAGKNEFFTKMKSRWDYNNRKYFQHYIAQVNNLVRMNRVDLLEVLIKDRSTFSTLSDSKRMSSDKKVIMTSYFDTLKPDICYEGKETLVAIYKIPFARNNVMQNFKGMLASSKIPRDRRKYIIFAYYMEDNIRYFSCRNNTKEDVQEYIQGKMELEEIGGHKPAFGMRMDNEKFIEFLSVVNDLRVDILNMDYDKDENTICYNTILDTGMPMTTLSNIALYNEVAKEPQRVHFKREDFSSVDIEKRRTVYTLPIGDIEQTNVVSFDLELKEEMDCIPKFKCDISDSDQLDILDM